MADDTTETPDTPVVPETIGDEVANAKDQAGDPTPAEPAVQLPPKERRAARRAAKAPASSGPTTLEEREAARLERRRRNATLRRSYRARAKAKRAERRASAPAPEPVEGHQHSASLRSSSASPGGRPKVRQGIVVSDKADKTIVVRIDVAKRHRRYGKIMRTSSKLHVHDEANTAGTGDTVRVVESRPLSATKRWRLVEVVERAR